MTRVLGERHGELRRAFPTGVATARQLAMFGFTERTVYRRCLDGGPWQRILPGIVLLFTGTPTRDQLVFAALLLCGADSVITGVEACRRHGMRRSPSRLHDELEVLVPHHRQVRSVGFVQVQRTERLPAPISKGGIPLAPLPRACIDAVRRLRSGSDVVELLSEPVQRGRCTVAELGAELEAGSRRGTAVPRRVLADMGEGIRSAAERAAQRLWRSAGLPEPWWNAEIRTADGEFLGIADCWVDDVAMVWEIESTEWHLSPSDHDRTVRRAAGFTAAGAVYTATKPNRVLREPEAVAAVLRATYEQARARPRPPLRATPARS
ncbi:hypothetical protein [Pseudonocardia humida]|uniref:Transcriptional regulator, AbiEi antitoxin, Type IV TA system n=1 Tax=Pseudonocardia humida TaxID=2800819 RepID=A0ABT1ABF4_9PSEU|nr:hypothetical protein [Pseudonocardia humida]MCO1660261.1 hypothetical protein [Pseudonocardia humida]